jgi:putative SOS response-associated peptidase YedK
MASTGDEMPFTVAGIYEYAVIDGIEYRSMSMLTINSDLHPFMNQFHAPEDEKRSIIVIPQDRRNDWLNCHMNKLETFSLKCLLMSSQLHQKQTCINSDQTRMTNVNF